MSFSATVKEELAKQVPETRHCQIAELAAILQYGGAIEAREDKLKHQVETVSQSKCEFSKLQMRLQGEHEALLKKCFTLIEKAFQIEASINDKSDKLDDKTSQQIEETVNTVHTLEVKNKEEIYHILEGIKYPKAIYAEDVEKTIVDSLLLKSVCCKRSFLRGVFLTCGSMSNPEKSYHLEYVCQSMEQAKQIQAVIFSFDVEAKIVLRKKYYVVYIKEGEGIVELLNVMGAHVSLMNFENFRILKEMRNDINRRVNCEAANITKTVNAASKQIEDIEYIKDHYGFQKLSEGLRSIAEARLDYPEATLKELGEELNPPVGKSGVNHRLRKLSDLADKLRG